MQLLFFKHTLVLLYAYEGKVLYQIGNLFGGYSLKHAEFVLNTTYRKNLKFNRIFL